MAFLKDLIPLYSLILFFLFPILFSCPLSPRFAQLSPEVEAQLSVKDIDVLYFMAEAPESSIAYLWRVEGGHGWWGLGGTRGGILP